jgi:transcriptional regulator with XRE-family HTH domain
MHRTYLADVERGARNLSLSSMARLVTGIGVTLSEFFATLESIDLAPAGHPIRTAVGSRVRKAASSARRKK